MWEVMRAAYTQNTYTVGYCLALVFPTTPIEWRSEVKSPGNKTQVKQLAGPPVTRTTDMLNRNELWRLRLKCSTVSYN
jgi:hypothetical protein